MAKNTLETDPYLKKCMKEMRDREMAHKIMSKQWEKEDTDHSTCIHYLGGTCMLSKEIVPEGKKCSAYKKRGRK